MKWLTKTNIFYTLSVALIGCALSFLTLSMFEFNVSTTSDSEVVTYLVHNKMRLITTIIAVLGIVIVMITEELTRKKPYFVSFGGAILVRLLSVVVLTTIEHYYFNSGDHYLHFIFWPLLIWVSLYGLKYPDKEGEDLEMYIIGSFVLLGFTIFLEHEYPRTIENIYFQAFIILILCIYLITKVKSLLIFSRKKAWFAFQTVLTCLCIFFISSSFVLDTNSEKKVEYPYYDYEYGQYQEVIIKADSLSRYIKPVTEIKTEYDLSRVDRYFYEKSKDKVSYSPHPDQPSELVLEGKLVLIQETKVLESIRINEELSYEEKERYFEKKIRKSCDNCELLSWYKKVKQ